MYRMHLLVAIFAFTVSSFVLAQAKGEGIDGRKQDEQASDAESSLIYEDADSVLDDKQPIEKTSFDDGQIAAPKSADGDTSVSEPVSAVNQKLDQTQTPVVEEKSKGWFSKRRRPGAIFGLAVGRPESIGPANYYQYLFGRPKLFPSLYAGYYLGSFLFDAGVIFKTGYYHAKGHPLKSKGSLKSSSNDELVNQEIDGNQTLSLTLIPTSASFELALSPFTIRWIVLRAWTGIEKLYFQETIEPNLPSGDTASTSSAYTSSGWNSGFNKGLMVSISLTGLDSRSDYALRSMGIDRMYLSPYIEISKNTQEKMGNFERKTYGLAFSFEGLR